MQHKLICILNRFSSHSEVCGDSVHCVWRWWQQQSWRGELAQDAAAWLSTAPYTKGSPVSSPAWVNPLLTWNTWLTWVQRSYVNAKIYPQCNISVTHIFSQVFYGNTHHPSSVEHTLCLWSTRLSALGWNYQRHRLLSNLTCLHMNRNGMNDTWMTC